MRPFFWISLGAVVGANCRYWLSRWAGRAITTSFPYGTLIINISGSFLLALFLTWTTERVLADPRWRFLIAIGFCGAFTTFSSYAFESMWFFEQGHWRLFWLNVAANNLLCLVGVIAGTVVARAI